MTYIYRLVEPTPDPEPTPKHKSMRQMTEASQPQEVTSSLPETGDHHSSAMAGIGASIMLSLGLGGAHARRKKD